MIFLAIINSIFKKFVVTMEYFLVYFVYLILRNLKLRYIFVLKFVFVIAFFYITIMFANVRINIVRKSEKPLGQIRLEAYKIHGIYIIVFCDHH